MQWKNIVEIGELLTVRGVDKCKEVVEPPDEAFFENKLAKYLSVVVQMQFCSERKTLYFFSSCCFINSNTFLLLCMNSPSILQVLKKNPF